MPLRNSILSGCSENQFTHRIIHLIATNARVKTRHKAESRHSTFIISCEHFGFIRLRSATLGSFRISVSRMESRAIIYLLFWFVVCTYVNYNALYTVQDDSCVRREIQLVMGWQCGRNVFNCFLKLLLLTVIGSSWRKCTGNLFQIVGIAKLNERFAVSVRLLGTSRSDLSDDLSDLTETLS